MQARSDYSLFIEPAPEVRISLNIQEDSKPSRLQRGTRYILNCFGCYKGLSPTQIAMQAFFSLIGGHEMYSETFGLSSRITNNWMSMSDDSSNIINHAVGSIFGLLALLLSMRAIGYSFKNSAQFTQLTEQLSKRMDQLEKKLSELKGKNCKENSKDAKKEDIEMVVLDSNPIDIMQLR